MISFTLVSLLLIGTAFAVEEDFSYDRQDEWPEICVSGNEMRQSPIDIDAESVEFDDDLIDLMMTNWNMEHDGTLINTGHTVQFEPDTPRQAMTQNHLGTYDVLQFHMHWGRTTGTGSEHLVSGGARELEIHFVHRKQNEPDETVFDAFSVVAVFATVDENAELTGPWAQLNISQIQQYNTSIVITGFRFDQFLPDNLDYYYYPGSLTTPTCREIVAWFVLRETITVPGAFLEQLRAVQGTDGEILGFNFRAPQALADRKVTTNSQTIVKPLLSLLMFSLVLIGLFSC